jgi:CRISPR-associated endonuclease/helicase Cas3
MTNARRAVYSLPALMNSAIVFDEIHAFDEQLFGHLLVFLKNFPKLPVLLMTASLSKQRIEALKQVRPDEIAFVPGNIEFETLKRYSIREISDLETAWQQVESCLASNGKVLWIRNRVDWANETYSQCRNRFPNIWSNVYHSRFRYKDRSRRHRRVIDVFNEEGRPAILVATQVAEMSLDLSADLLISDIALIPSLIQRMGRLNRRLKPNTPPKERKICPALIYSYPNLKQNELPYDFEQLEMAQKWVRCLQPKTALNQKDLADAFSGFENDAIFNLTQAEKNAIFFSGLWETRVGETRGEGNTTSVLLQADVEKFKREKRRDLSEWTRRHEVAIPIKNEIFKWAIFNGLRVAPPEFVKYEMDEYGEGTGAAWRK